MSSDHPYSDGAAEPHSLLPARVERWGLVPYIEAVGRMESLAARVSAGEIANTAILLEHPPVATLGVRGDATADLRVDAEGLRRLGIDLANTARGGQATIHSPGQLVAWFVYRLDRGRRALPRFLLAVEQLFIDAAAEFGVSLEARMDEVGLWIPGTRQKMGSVGLRFGGGATTHGVGFNIANDLSLFEHIVPCGLSDATMTRLLDHVPSSSNGAGRALFDAFAAKIAARFEQ